MKVRREKHLSNDASIYELINFIETKYYEMLRVANTELVTLFWRIGKEVNKYPAVTGINEKDIFSFSHISKLLSARYSKAFEQQNLDSMSRFANLFPDPDIVNQLAHYVSWEHILLLLEIKDEPRRIFYLRYKIEHGLTVKDLKKKISSGLYEKLMATGNRRERKKTMSIDSITGIKRSYDVAMHDEKDLGNVFNKSMLSYYRSLTTSPTRLSKPLTSSTGAKQKHLGILLSEIDVQVEKFRSHQTGFLNSILNLLFWEVGKRINRQIGFKKELQIKSIGRLASILGKKYGQNFSEKQLVAMSTFAGQFAGLSEVSLIAYLVSWEHILELLPLDDVSSKIFYAKLACIKNLTSDQLSKSIDKKLYEKSLTGSKSQSILRITDELKADTVTRKKRNSTEIITTVDHTNLSHHADVVNIFKNKYFVRFIKR